MKCKVSRECCLGSFEVRGTGCKLKRALSLSRLVSPVLDYIQAYMMILVGALAHTGVCGDVTACIGLHSALAGVVVVDVAPQQQLASSANCKHDLQKQLN